MSPTPATDHVPGAGGVVVKYTPSTVAPAISTIVSTWVVAFHSRKSERPSPLKSPMPVGKELRSYLNISPAQGDDDIGWSHRGEGPTPTFPFATGSTPAPPAAPRAPA